MPTGDSSLKTFALSVSLLVAAGGAVFAQDGDRQGADQWYGGQGTGFWGLGDSVGARGAVPGNFNAPGTNPETLNGLRQYGGYRLSNALAIEGSQTQFRPSASACNGAPSAGDTCSSSTAWSLSGVATMPFDSGLSLHGRLGLNYRQKGFQDDAAHRNADDPTGIGTVYGIGLSYELTKSITVHAESERYTESIGNSASGFSAGFGLDSSVHSIGLAIRF
jgi:opacity protein-like surface antigen